MGFCGFVLFCLFVSCLVGFGEEMFGGFLCFDRFIFSIGKPVSYIKIFKARTQSGCGNGNWRIRVFHLYIENSKQVHPTFNGQDYSLYTKMLTYTQLSMTDNFKISWKNLLF